MGLFSTIFKTIAGPLIGAASSGIGASQQNQQSEAAAQKQMDFQERMSNTQYQRAMTDMKSAGLNPILAYKQGGAGTPGGSTYSPVNVGSAATQGASTGSSSALAVRRTKAEIDNIKQDTVKKFQESNYVQENRGKLHDERNNLRQIYEVYKADAASARATQDFYNSPIGQWMRKLDLMGRSINPFANSAKSLRR